MKQQLSKDQFALWIMQKMGIMNQYQFDMLYDIRKIMTELQAYRGEINSVIKTEYHLMLRDTGCDLVQPSDENYSTYRQRSDTVYKLIFCWNEDYFAHPFCEVERL